MEVRRKDKKGKPLVELDTFIMTMNEVETYSGNLDEDLISWLRTFDDNFLCSKDNRQAAARGEMKAVKAIQLLAKLRDPARTVVEALPRAERIHYDSIVNFLKRTFLNSATAQVASAELSQAFQREKKTVNEYSVRISRIVERAYYDKSEDYRDTRKKEEFCSKLLGDIMVNMKPEEYRTFQEAKQSAAMIEQRLMLRAKNEARRKQLNSGSRTPVEAYYDENRSSNSKKYDKSKDVEYDPNLTHRRVQCDSNDEVESVHFYRNEKDAEKLAKGFQKPQSTRGYYTYKYSQNKR